MRSNIRGLDEIPFAGRSSNSANLFRSLFEEVPFGIAVGGSDNRLLRANRALCEMLGYDEDELVGKTFYDFTHPDDVARTEVFRKNITENRTPYQYVKRFRRKDGSAVLAKVTNSAVYGKTGELLFTIGVAENVTRQTELEYLRAQLAAVVEFSSDAICSLSLNGIIQTWNRGAEKIYGFSSKDAIGRPAAFLMPDVVNLGDAFSRAITDAKMGNSTQNLETIHRTKDGQTLPVSLTVSPIRNEFDQVVGVSLISRDMTAYKQALGALHQSEQKMRDASEGLARTNRELEQFAFVASHDLQEPLRTISCFLQLLEKKQKGRLDSEADEYIEFAVQGAKRMQRLILDLLQFSRSTRITQDIKPISLGESVEQAMFNLRGIIDKNDVTISYADLPTVMSNQQQMIQVFQNLFSNAIKFRSNLRPVIHVDAKSNEGTCIVSVTDNGIGFDPEHSDRIFLIFQRLHTRDQYPGTGVGLAICKKIVESHGGRIWAESALGKGAVFSFTCQQYVEPRNAGVN